MDGNESKNLWDQLSSFFRNYSERFVNWASRHGINLSKKSVKESAKKGKDIINRNSKDYALKCVKESGNTEELRSSGVYDGKEMREIAQIAKDRNIPILIRKEDIGYGRRELSNAQVQKITKNQKKLSKLKELQSRYAGDKTKRKKLRKVMKEIDILENQIKNDSKNKVENFSFIVNVSYEKFAKEIEETYGKTEIAKAEKEFNSRTLIEDSEKEFVSINKKNSEIEVADLFQAGNYGNIPVDSFENKPHLEHIIDLQSYVNMIRDPNFAETFNHSAVKKNGSNHIVVKVDAENEEQWLAFYDNDKVKEASSEARFISNKDFDNKSISKIEFDYSADSFEKLKQIHEENKLDFKYKIVFEKNESTPSVVMVSNLDREKIKQLIPEEKKRTQKELNKQWEKENQHLNLVKNGLSKEKDNNGKSQNKVKNKTSDKEK